MQELFAQVEADYEQALGSDAMLAQAVEDLKMQWISNTVNTASQ